VVSHAGHNTVQVLVEVESPMLYANFHDCSLRQALRYLELPVRRCRLLSYMLDCLKIKIFDFNHGVDNETHHIANGSFVVFHVPSQLGSGQRSWSLFDSKSRLFRTRIDIATVDPGVTERFQLISFRA
jgi:hypothetical protein